MMGHCDGFLDSFVSTPTSPVRVNKELEPYLIVPADEDLFRFGLGVHCSGTFDVVVSTTSTPSGFAGYNDVDSRKLEFEESYQTLPASVTLTIDATWVYAVGTETRQITIDFVPQSIFNGDYIELELTQTVDSPTVIVYRNDLPSYRPVPSTWFDKVYKIKNVPSAFVTQDNTNVVFSSSKVTTVQGHAVTSFDAIGAVWPNQGFLFRQADNTRWSNNAIEHNCQAWSLPLAGNNVPLLTAIFNNGVDL